MDTTVGRAARRELAMVLGLAFFGIVLVVLVAFAPWYEPIMAGSGGPSVIETIPPALVPDLTGVGPATLVEGR
jgi:hypothetical protein